MHYKRACTGSGTLVYTKVKGSRTSNGIPKVGKIGIHGCNYAAGAINSVAKGVGEFHITTKVDVHKKDVEVLFIPECADDSILKPL